MANDSYPNIRELGGHIVDLRRFTRVDNKNWSATNPSIGLGPKKNYALAMRSSNYVIDPNCVYTVTEGNRISAEIWFSELDKDWKLKDLRKLDLDGLFIDFTRGLEDPKLFWRDGAWRITAVMLEGHTPTARIVTAKLDVKNNKVVDLEKMPGVDAKKPEKNWMVPYEPNPNFDFIYGPTAFIKDNTLTTKMLDNPELSGLRGTSNLHDLGDRTYLAVMHRKITNQEPFFNPQTFGSYTVNKMNYTHSFVRFDYSGNITHFSRPFQFHQPGVEFCAGIVEHGKDFVMSFGREDVSSHLAFLSKDRVMHSLNPVTNY